MVQGLETEIEEELRSESVHWRRMALKYQDDILRYQVWILIGVVLAAYGIAGAYILAEWRCV